MRIPPSLLALAAFAAFCCGSAEATAPAPALYALLADNRLLALDSDARVLYRLRLGPVEREPSMGPHLVLAPGGRLLYVLVQGSARSGDSVAFVDTRRRTVVARIRLPRGTIFRALALAPRSRRLYAVGDRPARGPQQPVVAALDARRRRLLWSTLVPRGGGLDWFVYDSVVEPGERSLLVSYHGGSTTGADRFDLRPGGVAPCTPPPRAYGGTACIALHGRVEPYRGKLVAATGDPRRILLLDRDGTQVGRLDPRLDGNHLMEFALDRRRGLLFAVGSCGYSGGLSEVEIGNGRTLVLERPRDRRVCGDRIVVMSPTLLAIAAPPRPVPSVGFGGAVEVVRRSDGGLVGRLPTPADPVDVVAAPHS